MICARQGSPHRINKRKTDHEGLRKTSLVLGMVVIAGIMLRAVSYQSPSCLSPYGIAFGQAPQVYCGLSFTTLIHTPGD